MLRVQALLWYLSAATNAACLKQFIRSTQLIKSQPSNTRLRAIDSEALGHSKPSGDDPEVLRSCRTTPAADRSGQVCPDLIDRTIKEPSHPPTGKTIPDQKVKNFRRPSRKTTQQFSKNQKQSTRTALSAILQRIKRAGILSLTLSLSLFIFSYSIQSHHLISSPRGSSSVDSS
jgi:hypothetical protein